MAYQFDHEWEHERARLAALEAVFDPCTKRSILATEPRRGWSCLEVGGGGGSIAAWLCDLVGDEGSVVATDLETKFLKAIDAPNLRVRKHDIVRDSLGEESFDLVHSRAVLDHLPERDAVLQKLLHTLRPGGWLTLEGGDFSSVRAVGCADDEAEFFNHGFQLVIDAARAIGFDPLYGRRLGSALREAGLTETVCEGVVFEWSSEHAFAQLYSMTFQRLRDPVVERGIVSAHDFDRLVGMMTRPGFHAISNTVFAARGRKSAT